MTAQEMIVRLRKMKGSGDNKGAFLGDGIHDSVRAFEVADELERLVELLDLALLQRGTGAQ